MNRKWTGMLVAMLLVLFAFVAFAEEAQTTPPPSITVGDVTPTPVAPPSIDIGDVTPVPEQPTPVPPPPVTPEPQQPVTPVEPDVEDDDDGGSTYVPPVSEIRPDPIRGYAGSTDGTVAEESAQKEVIPEIALVATAGDLASAQVETSSSSVSMQIGDGLHSETMAKAADDLSENLAEAVSQETLDELAQFAGTDAQNLGAVVSLPLADIVVTLHPGEESAKVLFDLSELDLAIGDHTAGLVTTLSRGVATFSAVEAQVENGKVTVELPADVLNLMAFAQETMFSLLAD